MKVDPLTGNLKLLTGFAHPDDESMGMGGTLANILQKEWRRITSALHAGREAGSAPRNRILACSNSANSAHKSWRNP